MELREFAERVLFATTLEEKLRWVEDITDERPGAPRAAPEAPGRPPELRFRAQGAAKTEFPGVHRLEQERERGRLLHFFGNHELLATELMALALLKFPDAPSAFRRGVLNTLRDEQVHTRLYLRRMRECGIEFGELPVSGFFWRCAATMASPLDYVASLCLTFEQANLDFAHHFSQGFAAVGDAQTAQLLDRIYRDEIGHVAYGLQWFRRWKSPGESDWEAFRSALRFPLSPRRARGSVVNFEGRLAAGFDPAFIAELNVYGQSKGRTPSVYVFNPFAEGRIARGGSFNPTKAQAQLGRDLANLPQFLARQDDIVLVPERPSVEFLSRVKQAGYALPEFVEVTEGGIGRLLARRKLGALRPWAWGPDSLELLAPLLANVTGETRTAEQRFNRALAELYSKAWSAGFLSRVLNQPRTRDATDPRARGGGSETWLCSPREVGVAVATVEDALRTIAAIRERGHHPVVVKEALGLAGQNAMRLWEPELLETQRQWIANALRDGRQLVIEPWLRREVDFSVQLEMGPERLKLRGYTGLINDSRGRFQGNWAEPNHPRRIPARVLALFPEPADMASRLHTLYETIVSMLEAELQRAGHVGPVGIDAFVYRTPEGDCRLKPVVEINPRFTMGRLTLELMKQAAPGSCGRFRLVSRPMAQAEGFADFAAYAQALTRRFPLRLEGQPVPRIREGALCLNDPTRAQARLAVFEVFRGLPR